MPSTATITAFYSFVASTANSPSVIRSAEVNTNFSNYRGHIIAVDPSTATAAATATYDLGASDRRWRNVYGSHVPSIVSTTGSYTLLSTDEVFLANDSGSTITATLPAVASVPTGKIYTIKKIGSAATVLVDGNGSETIDGSITSALLTQYESISLISNGSAWHIV